MRFKIFIFCVFCVLRASSRCDAQITSAAQGGNAASWSALGLVQQMRGNWRATTNIGTGMHSDPDKKDLKIAQKMGVFVAKQSFSYQLSHHLAISSGLGYWRKYKYASSQPYDKRPSPLSYRNEFRSFSKVNYSFKLGNIKIGQYIRPEFRFFYNQNLSGRWPTPFEFRIRYRLSGKIPLNKKRTNYLVILDEVFSATDKYGKTNAGSTTWSPYKFTENRLSLFYKHSFIKNKLDLDVGIMNQYWRKKMTSNGFNVTNTLMVDLIIYDIFSKKD